MTSLLLAQSFTPSTTAVAGNVFLTAVVGLLPLIVFFVLMGVFKVATHWCSIISLVLSLGIAVFAFKMPLGMALLSGTQGAAMGFMPIIYIIIAAVWLYNLTEKSGRSSDLKAVFNTMTSVRRPSSSPGASVACSRAWPASARPWPSPAPCS